MSNIILPTSSSVRQDGRQRREFCFCKVQHTKRGGDAVRFKMTLQSGSCPFRFRSSFFSSICSSAVHEKIVSVQCNVSIRRIKVCEFSEEESINDDMQRCSILCTHRRRCVVHNRSTISNSKTQRNVNRYTHSKLDGIESARRVSVERPYRSWLPPCSCEPIGSAVESEY